MAWRVRTFYINARTMSAAEKDGSGLGVSLPDGWEPIGGDIETGGALRLVLARKESEREVAARYKEIRTKRDDGELSD